MRVIASLLLVFSGYALSAESSDVFDIDSIQNLTTQNSPSAPPQQHDCQSIVCNSYAPSDATSPSHDYSNITVVNVPERNSNETLDAIGSALYIIGEIGFAENLSEPDYRNNVPN